MKFIDFFAGVGGFRRGMELAGLRGAKRENILCSISRWKKGTVRCPGYIVVEVEDDLPF